MSSILEYPWFSGVCISFNYSVASRARGCSANSFLEGEPESVSLFLFFLGQGLYIALTALEFPM